MADSIYLFPTLTEELLQKVRFQPSQYSFFYTDREGLGRELQCEEMEVLSSVICIRDESGEWDQDKNDFGIRRRICFRTFQCLFGPSGIACRNAVLGIAIIWKSADSKQRGVIPAGTFSNKDEIIEGDAEKLFGKAQLRGQVSFHTVVYIAKAGSPEKDEEHLANTDGYILGELDAFTIRMDGTGSAFPVFEVYEPGQPLWYVRCDWVDPTADALSDFVSVNLNTAHRNYKYIDRTKSTYNSQLLTEIMAAAVSVIIEKLRPSPYWDQIIGNDNLEDGSVGQAVFYFSDALEWDLSTPESVSLSARKFFDQRM